MIKNKTRNTIDFMGSYNSYIHISTIGNTFRVQVNANDVFYSDNYKDVKKLSQFIFKLSEKMKNGK